MNSVTITGRLVAAPDCRYTQNGKCVTEITLAVDRGYGEKKKTSFIPCQVWEKRAETLANSGLDKGHRLLVNGAWCQQSWETNDGQKRRKDYVLIDNFEFLEKRQNNEPNGNSGEIDINSFEKDVFPGDDQEIPF